MSLSSEGLEVAIVGLLSWVLRTADAALICHNHQWRVVLGIILYGGTGPLRCGLNICPAIDITRLLSPNKIYIYIFFYSIIKFNWISWINRFKFRIIIYIQFTICSLIYCCKKYRFQNRIDHVARHFKLKVRLKFNSKTLTLLCITDMI